MKQQAGFTLIELIMVIVILGVLGAVAVPKFVDMSSDAEKAAVKGVAGGLSSAATINYAAKKMGKTATDVNTCTGHGPLLQGGLPTGYTITGAFTSGDAEGVAATCTVTHTNGETADFTGIVVGAAVP